MADTTSKAAHQPFVNGMRLTSEPAVVSRFVSRMRIDRWTAEVVSAFRERGIQTVLLKGPVIARWLYAEESTARTYSDVDLLVAPAQFSDAEDALRDLGFACSDDPECPMWHAWAWARPTDGASVDLHRTLHSMEGVSPELVWNEVIAGAESCEVHGVRVDIPGPVMRTLHVVLHLGSTEEPRSQASEDLARAVAQVDRPTWQAAADLARRLGVDGDMGLKLAKSAHGSELVDNLGLSTVGSLRTYVLGGLHQSELPGSFYLLSCLASKATYRAKLRWLVQWHFPPRSYMEQRHPVAASFGLPVSYGIRAIWGCVRLPGVIVKWIAYRRGLRRTLRGQRPLR